MEINIIHMTEKILRKLLQNRTYSKSRINYEVLQKKKYFEI